MADDRGITVESSDVLLRRYGSAYLPLLTGTAVTAAFTMMVSGTSIGVVVPDVMGAFGVGQDKAQLMATAFYIAMTVSQLLSAWLSGLLGQRRAFSLALLLFAVASVLGAAAEDFGVIVLVRLVQGVGAGVIQTLTMLTLFQAFPPERRGTAMGFYAAGMVLAIGVGPALGGVVVEAFGWRYIFLAPLPLVLATFVAGLFAMSSARSAQLPAFDWLGYALLIAAFYCVMTGLADGQRQGWTSDTIVGLFVAAALTGGAFIWLQISRPVRLVDFSLFRRRPFLVSSFVGFMVGMGNFGSIYAVPVFAQLVQNLTPVDAGMLMLPASLIAICAMPLIGRLADSITARTGIVIGLLFFAVGTLPLGLADVNTPFLHILLFVVVIRLGMSVNLPFVTRTALASLPADKVDIGAGTLNFCRQLGASLGTAVWVVFLDIRTHFHSDALAATQNSANDASQELLSGVRRMLAELGFAGADHQSGALHYLGQVVHAQATARGFQDGFLILSLGFIVAIVPACLLGRGRPGS